jgi:hypothetical protein
MGRQKNSASTSSVAKIVLFLRNGSAAPSGARSVGGDPFQGFTPLATVYGLTEAGLIRGQIARHDISDSSLLSVGLFWGRMVPVHLAQG